MHKRFLAIIGLLFVFIPLFSQTKAFSSEWSFGVNGGMNLSRMRFSVYPPNPSIAQDYLQQETGGIVVRYISEKHFGIQGELNYSRRGWKDTTDETSPNKFTRSLTYIEMPLFTHIYFGLGKRVRLIVNLGPQIAYNIGDKVTEIEIAPGSSEKYYYDMSIKKKFDYGIKGGLGFELRTGIGSFIVEGRYYFGLSDIYNNSKSDVFQASSHQVIGINLTYLFRK